MEKNVYRVALLLALGSGCAALSHELLWTRRLVDLLGASYESTARVFGCFFLGLSIGAAWSTRWTGRIRRPWLAVAAVELGIGLATLPALFLPHWTSWVWSTIGPDGLTSWPGSFVKLVLSVSVVLPPATLMGMALPLLSFAVLQRDRTLSREGVWLYAVNTGGGVVGLLLTSLGLLSWFGVSGAMASATMMNLAVAMGCFIVHRATGRDLAASTEGTDVETQKETQRAKKLPKRRVEPASQLAWLLVLSFLSGGAVLATEILAIHLFSLVVPSTIYTTAAVLTMVIMTLFVSAMGAPLLERRLGAASRLLSPVCAATAVGTIAAPVMFFRCTGQLSPLPETGSVFAFVAQLCGYLAVTFGPALLCAGLVFPLIISLYGKVEGDRYGRRWGILLAANGVGGLLGAELTNSMLIPAAGMHRGLAVVATVYGIAAILIALRTPADQRFPRSAALSVSALVIVALVAAVWIGSLPQHGPLTEGSLIQVKSGAEGVVTITHGPRKGNAIFLNNQYLLGSENAFYGQRRKTTLPLLLHSAPKRVACIAMGTGITAGAALDYPGVERLEVIEISPLVADAAAEYFSETNRGLFHDPRSKVIVEDGRTYIAACRASFDVLVGDLFRPWGVGEGRLYSMEHFRACRRSLRPGGLFCQWLPMYLLTAGQFEVILATFQRVFPETHLFRSSFRSTIPQVGLIGIRDGSIDWAEIEPRCALVRTQGRILDPMMRHAEGVLMHYYGVALADNEGEVNSLDNNWIEIHAGQWRVSSAAKESYLLGPAWLQFDSELSQRGEFPEDSSVEFSRWSKAGHTIIRLHDATVRHRPDAKELLREVFLILSAGVWPDEQADWNAFPIRFTKKS